MDDFDVQPDDDELVTIADVAAEYPVKPSTLRTWRSLDDGPKSFKIGRTVVYRRGEVRRWIRRLEAETARGGN